MTLNFQLEAEFQSLPILISRFSVESCRHSSKFQFNDDKSSAKFKFKFKFKFHLIPEYNQRAGLISRDWKNNRISVKSSVIFLQSGNSARFIDLPVLPLTARSNQPLAVPPPGDLNGRSERAVSVTAEGQFLAYWVRP